MSGFSTGCSECLIIERNLSLILISTRQNSDYCHFCEKRKNEKCVHLNTMRDVACEWKRFFSPDTKFPVAEKTNSTLHPSGNLLSVGGNKDRGS